MTIATPVAGWVHAVRIDTDDVPPSPWRNGGGVTRELLRVPVPDDAGAAAGGWLLRISLADIASDGPFSAFEGMDRWFAVVGGAGVRLAWPDGERDPDPRSPGTATSPPRG